jgi:hypothetical protein
VEVLEVAGRDDVATAHSVLVILAGEGATEIRNVVFIEQAFLRVDQSWKITRRSVSPVLGPTGT